MTLSVVGYLFFKLYNTIPFYLDIFVEPIELYWFNGHKVWHSVLRHSEPALAILLEPHVVATLAVSTYGTCNGQPLALSLEPMPRPIMTNPYHPLPSLSLSLSHTHTHTRPLKSLYHYPSLFSLLARVCGSVLWNSLALPDNISISLCSL